MKKIELLYREILYQAMEKKNFKLTQSALARALKLSLSTVNFALQPLKKMNSIDIKTRGFEVIDVKKILYYWASIRNLNKDIIYQTRVEMPVREIEKSMPPNLVFAAFSAYKFEFKDVPADYSEVYVYADDLEEIKKRFPLSNKPANLFVLKKDDFMKENTTTTAQTFVDLWNLPQWYAKDFLKALEKRMQNGILE